MSNRNWNKRPRRDGWSQNQRHGNGGGNWKGGRKSGEGGGGGWYGGRQGGDDNPNPSNRGSHQRYGYGGNRSFDSPHQQSQQPESSSGYQGHYGPPQQRQIGRSDDNSRWSRGDDDTNSNFQNVVDLSMEMEPQEEESVRQQLLGDSQQLKQSVRPWEEMTFIEKYKHLRRGQCTEDELDRLDHLAYDNFRGFSDVEWKEKQNLAVAATIESLRARLNEEAKLGQEQLSDEYASDESSLSDAPENKPNYKEPDDLAAPFLRFIRALPDCVPFTWGFHVINLYPDQNKICYCPCSNKMRIWREKYDLEDLLEQYEGKACGIGSSGNFEPHPMVKHVESKMSNYLHWICWIYIKHLYKDYLQRGIDHMALYEPNTTEFTRAEALERRQINAFIGDLQMQISLANEELAKQRQLEADLQNLRARNKDLAEKFQKQIEVEKDLKKKLGIHTQQKKAVSRTVVNSFRKTYDTCTKAWRMLDLGAFEQENAVGLKFNLTQKFSLQELFQDARRRPRNATQLFSKITETQAKLFGYPMYVHFRLPDTVLLNERAKKEFEAIDDGGCTRAFLSTAWKQLASLSLPPLPTEPEFLETERIGKKLFGKTNNMGCKPNRDDFFQINNDDIRVELHGIATDFFRAIGRLIAYCICHQIPIASHVMPPLYRNYLLRGISPHDDDYELADLAQHVSTLINLEGKSVDETVTCFLDFADDDESSFDVDDGVIKERGQQFRNAVHKYFIADCSLTLDALEQGIHLRGIKGKKPHDYLVPADCFRSMPLDVLSEIIFAKSEITAEDVIDCLVPEYLNELDLDLKLMVLRVEGDQVLGVLPDLLRDRGDNKKFLSRFVFFVTGQWFVSGDLKIIVEFNHCPEEIMPDSWPVAHSCVHTLKLPSTAYDGNKEALAEKLDLSLKYMKKLAFSMQ